MTRLIVDIETNSTASHIWLCCTKDIDTGEVWTWKEATDELREYLNKAEVIVGHNFISFDAPILNRLWNTKIRLSQIHDTLILSRLLNPVREDGHSLDSWGNRLGLMKIDYSKIWSWITGTFLDKNNSSQPFDEPVMNLLEYYCIRDVELTGKLYEHLRAEQEKTKTSESAFQLEMQTQSIIAVQERNGFKLDIPYAMSLLSTIKGEMDEIVSKMREVFPDIVHKRVSEKTGKALQDRVEIFNVGSRQQIAARLMGLGWKPTKFTEKGSIIVDEAVLEGVNIPEAKFIARYLMLQKRAAQLESWLEHVESDGRVHGKVFTLGAVTNRMTHNSPNMAQVPAADDATPYGHEFRRCWTVEEGNVLVGIDASGLELRMLAHYMNDPEYTEIVINGKSEDGTDIHTKNQVAAGLQSRAQAKTFIYGFLYGAGPAKIGSIVGGTAKEGKKLIDSFLKNTPKLKALREKVARLALKGYLPGLDGRILWVRSEHAALNTLLQGAGAIVMKKSLSIFSSELKRAKLFHKFVANIHDEWQIECKPEDAETIGKLGVWSIEEAGRQLNMRCPLTGSWNSGKTWEDTH